MGQFFDEIPENVLEWLKKQEMFWVATAPLSAEGHVHVSPKGIKDTIHAISKNKFWYEDLSGSGAETIAHLRDNPRITILFHAFEGPPRVCRLFGKGTFHEYGSEDYSKYIPDGTRLPGSRAVIVIDIHKVGTSCGYAVPFYQFLSHRSQLLDVFDGREKPDSKFFLPRYWVEKNAKSMDGMPSVLDAPHVTCEFKNCWQDKKGSYEEANAARLATLERIQEQTEAGSGKQAGSVAISNSKVIRRLGYISRNGWIKGQH